MEGLKVLPYLFLIFAIVGIVAGATAVTLGKFGESVDQCWNSSYTYVAAQGVCVNATVDNAMAIPGATSPTNLSLQMYTVSQGQTAGNDIAEQLPTVGIIGVMVVIISVLAGVFVYLRYFG